MERGTTKKRHPMRMAVALVAVGIVALTACGSSGDSSADSDKKGSSGAFELVEGSTPAMLTELKTAIDNKEPIVVTLWRPHWAYSAFDIKDLADPKGAMGEGEEIWGVANKAWVAENAELAKAFGDFKLDDEALASLENFVFNINDGDEVAGVKAWLADGDNQQTADGWIGDLKGAGQTVTIGLIPWDEDIAVTELWKNLLEARDFKVEIKEVDAGILFQGMADGDIDVFFDAWLPETHKDYWAKNGDKLEKLGQWYEGKALLTIAVPSYVDIDSLDELAAHADEFKGKIIGIEPGAGLTRVTKEEAMPAYGL